MWRETNIVLWHKNEIILTFSRAKGVGKYSIQVEITCYTGIPFYAICNGDSLLI